jgi:hypothetical protein
MSEEYEDLGPEAESRAETAAAVEYGERYEACQVTARKVMAAKRLIELAGGYKEAMILADALWFADTGDADDATAGANDADEDFPEGENGPDCKAWLARTRRVMAAEKLLRLASGYAEIFVLLDTVEVAMHGDEGLQQVRKVRNAAAGYHDRVAAALRRRDEGE